MLNEIIQEHEGIDTEELFESLNGKDYLKSRQILKECFPCLSVRTIALTKCYASSRRANIRADCIFFCFYAASQGIEEAINLGLIALEDKSKFVRYQACKLLAYSKSHRAIPFLIAAKNSSKSNKNMADILATISAIEKQNSNLFVDRNGTGKITMQVVERP